MERKDIFIGLAAAVLLALFVSPFASRHPDGLERVAEDKGFMHKVGIRPMLTSPVPDYAWPWINNERLATSAAGVFGTVVVFGIGWLAGRALKR